jgi:hypothetical protein
MIKIYNQMKTSSQQALQRKIGSLSIIFLICFNELFAQPETTQALITVTVTQLINFGTFCVTGNSGGTITVAFDGSRTCTGAIVLLSNNPIASPAIFEIKLSQGRNTYISYNPQSILTTSNGSKLQLDIGPSDKGVNGSSLTSVSDVNFISYLTIGGTLHIPGTAPPGNYSGSFDITFN